MKIVNKSKNTIYIDDIDFYIPFKDLEPENLDADVLKKSRSLRSVILSDMIDIIDYNENERIENSLVYLKNSNKKNEKSIKKEEQQIEQQAEEIILEKTAKSIDVKIHGIFYDASGYGKVNRNLAIKLHESGVNVKIDPKRSQNQLISDELQPFINLTKTKIGKNHILIDSVIPSQGEMSSGKYKILYTTIESYSVPKQLAECCNLYDEIWTTSQWSKSILETVVNKPVYSIVPGVDMSLYTDTGPKFDFKPNIKKFVFLSVFGWNYRKGYDVLLKAYFDEFSDRDDVSLLIFSRYQSGQSLHHKNKIKNDIEDIMKNFPNKDLPHVVRYNKVLNEKDMPKLYRSSDCFVLVPRGESISLTPMEASMCGLPVIMTNCSGQQEYLRPDNSYLLEIDKIEESLPGQFKIHYWDGQKFPLLTSQKVHNDLRKLMRTAFENTEISKQKNKNMKKLLTEKFSWNNTANSALQRLLEIKEKIGE